MLPCIRGCIAHSDTASEEAFKSSNLPGNGHTAGKLPINSGNNMAGVRIACGFPAIRYIRRMRRRIAIVEDDPVIRANYADVLNKHGYEVVAYGDRGEALAALRGHLPDLVLLDIGLGDEVDGGFTLCRELRTLSGTLPIIFLTARDGDFDTVSGLRMGADDYVTKNVSLPHLLARVSALFRRAELAREPAPGDDILDRGSLKLDLNRFSASWQGRELDLTLTEFWLVH